ncbi:MAG TPA: ABC-2 family transporter protein [Lachnospiraceae bacterium]|nr:ABC-2 family transporter protein [Lachnospiraceae bacterium]
MMRNLRFIKELIKLRMSRLMMFRLGFFGPFFVDGTLFIVQLIVFQAIYSNVDTIGGFGRGEMIIFIGTFSLINALNMVIYFFGVITIPDKIRSGDLDLYLTKPVNPLLRITFENVNPGSIPLLIFSVAIIIYGVNACDIQVSILRVVGYLGFVLIMTVLFYDVEVIIRTITFFVISAVNLTRLEDAGIELCMKMPGTILKGVFKILFYCILPYGVMATIPTQYLTGTISREGILFGVAIVVIFTVFTLSFWRWGVKHYNSASS